ncbi:hypothetical protein TNCV_832661 [Trichonephila clavipes]|nr:hypothetical protein TNCV_832661 [Trichonephila clavipes]
MEDTWSIPKVPGKIFFLVGNAGWGGLACGAKLGVEKLVLGSKHRNPRAVIEVGSRSTNRYPLYPRRVKN